jgi:heptosyltransferase-2/heptosyltransferase-3
MRPNPRPLVMRCGALGDMVMLTPLIEALAARFGTPVDIVSSGAWTPSLLAGQPDVGELYMLASRRRPYLISPDQWQLVRRLRARGTGPTWFLDLHGLGRSLLARAGIGAQWIVDAESVPRHRDEHCLDRYLRIAAANPVALLDPPAPPQVSTPAATRLVVSAQARAEVGAWLERHQLGGRRLLAVQAGNKRTMRRGNRRRASNTKYWPEARWTRVLHAMRARCPEHAILLLGVAQERALNDEILALADCPDTYNVAGDRPVPFLMALLERSDAMVSVDTGPAHVAAAVGVPLLVMFGAGDAIQYVPRGAPAATVECLAVEPPAPLEQMPEATVLAAWARLPLRGVH